jgi:hypothetical protein
MGGEVLEKFMVCEIHPDEPVSQQPSCLKKPQKHDIGNPKSISLLLI